MQKGFGYVLVKWLVALVVRIFFQDVQLVGESNLPRKGPVILVGNHQNQFVDALVLFSQCSRDVQFLIAAKSLTKPVVGTLARNLRCIPVQRRIDAARSATGRITTNGNVVIGHGTHFLTDVSEAEQLQIKSTGTTPVVKEIIDDEHIELMEGFGFDITEPTDFTVLAKLNHRQMFDSVYSTLGAGGVIGIFPEGGSHDRPELLPLKAGVSIMALGAYDRHGVPPTIIPCGLTYFSGHRFRSRVMIEFGEPIQFTSDLLPMFKKDKKTASGILLERIERGLRNVTINVPSNEWLRCTHVARRLYQPKNLTLSVESYLRLMRRLAAGFTMFQHEPQVLKLMKDLHKYDMALKDSHLKDQQVVSMDFNRPYPWRILFQRLVMFFGLLLVALPGLIVHLPIAGYAKLRAQREARKAAASSSVKLEGKDVIASQKIVLAFTLLPVVYTTLFSTLWYWLGLPLALLAMCAVPPISFASLMIVERVVLLGQSLIPLLLWPLPSYRNLLASLFQRRATLQKRVRELVEELGPKLGKEVWNQRIVANADFEYESQAEQPSNENTVWPQRQSYASATSGPSRVDRANPLDMLGTSLDSIQEELEHELDI